MKIPSLILVTAVGVLTACGGGGGSTTAELSTSQFIDSPVKGLYYVTASGVTGTTDAAGTFQFKDGDSVTFKVGGADGLEIAATTPTNGSPTLVTELAGGQQIAQILQTFSTSDDPDTGLDLSVIEFTADQRTKLRKHITDSGELDDFATGDLATIATAVTERVREKLGDSSLTFAPKAASAVTAHLEKTLAKPEFKPKALAGFKNKIYFVHDSVPDGIKAVMGYNEGSLRVLFEDLYSGTGSVISSADDLLKIKLDTVRGWDSEDTASLLDCKVDFAVKESFNPLTTGVNGFSAEYTVSTGCDTKVYADSEFKSTANFVEVDAKLNVKDFLGKTLVIPAGELTVNRDDVDVKCGEISLAFSQKGVISVTTPDDTNACNGNMKFYQNGKIMQFGAAEDGTGGVMGLVLIGNKKSDGKTKYVIMGRSYSMMRFNQYANFTATTEPEGVPSLRGGGRFNYKIITE